MNADYLKINNQTIVAGRTQSAAGLIVYLIGIPSMRALISSQFLVR
jgi:hypothetical protein